MPIGFALVLIFVLWLIDKHALWRQAIKLNSHFIKITKSENFTFILHLGNRLAGDSLRSRAARPRPFRAPYFRWLWGHTPVFRPIPLLHRAPPHLTAR